MRKMAEKTLSILKNCPNGMFMLVRALKTDNAEVEGRRCMTGSDG